PRRRREAVPPPVARPAPHGGHPRGAAGDRARRDRGTGSARCPAPATNPACPQRRRTVGLPRCLEAGVGSGQGGVGAAARRGEAAPHARHRTREHDVRAVPDEGRSAMRSALAPLRDARFAWFYAARVVSTAGSAMAPVALTFAVLAITHSATALGLVLAARTVPMVLFILIGGVVSDRFSRAAVIRTANLLSGATQTVVAVLVITGSANLWTLVAIEALNGTVSAFTMPAMQSVLPQLVRREHLQPANALLSFSRSGLNIIGPTVAALLVASVGPGWALAADALSWLVAAALIGRVSLPSMPRRGDANMLRELREGWTVFTGNTWLWVVVAGFGVMNAIHAGAWFTLGPSIALDTFGARGWGLVLSAESVGLLVMTLVMLRVRLRRPLLAGMLGMLFFVGSLA